MSRVVAAACERPTPFGRLLLRLVRTTAPSLLVVVMGIALGSSSRAVEPEEVAGTGDDSNWLPSASVFGALLRAPAEADLTSSARPGDQGSALFIDPGVGLGAEILTPAIAVGPIEIRAVAHADAAFDFGVKRQITKEGDPGPITPLFEFPAGYTPQPADFGGQGSVTKVKPQPLQLFAGAGLSLGLDLWDRHVRIKPTLEYRRDEMKITGLVNDVAPDPMTDVRMISISGSDKQVFHSLGPGLEIEADAARAGDFAVSFFLTGRAWTVLGDREVTLRESCCSDTGPTESAVFHFERDPWSFGTTTGIRVRWSPE